MFINVAWLDQASAIIGDPNLLIVLVSKRVRQLYDGASPLIQTLENLTPENIALREIIEGKIRPEFSDSVDHQEGLPNASSAPNVGDQSATLIPEKV